MIAGKRIEEWLAHRAGQQGLRPDWGTFETKALELNRRGRDFTATFGRSDVRALIGFVDLIGFSTHVEGAAPSAVAQYALPFLNQLSSTILEFDALVDKTIGDEVMFVLPDVEAERGVPLILAADRLIGRLWHLRQKLADTYPFRLGLAVGTVHVGRIEAKGYGEWSVFGEPVNFAKRITGVPEQAPFADMGAWGAMGVLQREPDCHVYFDALLRYYPSDGDMANDLALCEVNDPPPLKGISDYRGATLTPLLTGEGD